MRQLPWALILALLSIGAILGTVMVGSAGDRIKFSSPAPGYEIGVLVDGKRGGAAVNDESHTVASGSDLDVEDLEAGTNNEVVVFQPERMVTLQSASWTSGDDEITVTQPAEKGVSIAIWYLKEFNAVAFNRSVAACARMSQIWHDEGLGLKVTGVEFHQEAVGKVNSFLDFKCSGPGCSRGEQLLRALEAVPAAPVASMLNIYYVDTVDWGGGYASTNGVWCGNNMIVLGSTARVDLMVHEVGHSFELDHTDDLTGFDETNVMWSLSNTRSCFTEGQTFRAHLDVASAINTTYGLRATSDPIRTCGDFGSITQCPDLALRIWPDTP